jgi:hypothetical protein
MKYFKKIFTSLFIILLFSTLSGCQGLVKDFVGGFVLISLIIGIPVFILMFLGGIFSNLKHKGKYSSIDGSLFENIIGLVVILIFVFGFVKACSS